jgi:hypothetical protein
VKIAPIPSRLDFVAAGRAALDFVTEPPYSLWLTEQDEGRIAYEGDDVMLVLLHDDLSYELDLALWRPSVVDEARHPFTMSDIIRVTDPAKARDYRSFSAASDDSVRRGVAILVSDFREYGLAALTGEGDFYRQMLDARSEAAREFATEIADKAARERAEQAWLRRDFEEVIVAYRSMEDRLSRAERARLHYAAKRLGK